MKITAEARDLREVNAVETELNIVYQLIREAAKSSNSIEFSRRLFGQNAEELKRVGL